MQSLLRLLKRSVRTSHCSFHDVRSPNTCSALPAQLPSRKCENVRRDFNLRRRLANCDLLSKVAEGGHRSLTTKSWAQHLPSANRGTYWCLTGSGGVDRCKGFSFIPCHSAHIYSTLPPLSTGNTKRVTLRWVGKTARQVCSLSSGTVGHGLLGLLVWFSYAQRSQRGCHAQVTWARPPSAAPSKSQSPKLHTKAANPEATNPKPPNPKTQIPKPSASLPAACVRQPTV